MKFLNDKYWNTLPFPDYRARFYVESFWELLSKNSPHFHQARLMNVLSCATEVLESLEEYEKDERNLSSLKNAVDEFSECWSKDVVVNEVYRSIINSTTRIIKQFNTDKINSAISQRLRFICNSILSKEAEYITTLTDKLKSLMLHNIDLTKKERLTSEIYNTLNLYITYMLNKGYSPTYLFNRMEHFTRHNNYKGKTFEEQFTNVINRMSSEQKQYTLCFGILTSDKRPFLNESGIFSVNFTELPPVGITGAEISQLNRKSVVDLFATIEVKATDYIGAAWNAKELLAKSFDFVLYGHSSVTVTALNSCISLVKIADITHKRNVNISFLIDFLTSHSKPYVNEGISSIFSRSITPSLTDEGLNCIARSLRYLRLGKETPSLEKKFLNIWIALESLFGKNDNSIIGNLTNYIPLIYALRGITARVDYLIYLLKKNKVPIPKSVIDKYGLDSEEFDDSIKSEVFFKIVQDESSAKEIFNSCAEREHLKFRFLHTYEEIKSPEKILVRVKKSVNDVERQLKRIYLVRNKIAHRGHYEDIRPQLVNHLFDYTSICFESITSTLISTRADHCLNVSDALLAYKLGAEDIYHKLETKPPIIGFDDLIIRPL